MKESELKIGIKVKAILREDGKLVSIDVGPRDLDIIPHLRRGLVVTYFRSSGVCHY